MKRILHKSIIGILFLGALLAGCSPIDIGSGSNAPVDPVPVISQHEYSVISLSNENVNQEIFGEYKSNFGVYSIENINYEGYRIGVNPKDSEELFILDRSLESFGIAELPGSFANVDLLDGISSISITYKCDGDFQVLYGNDRNHFDYVQEIQGANDYTTYDIDFVSDASYFRIEAYDERLSVKSLELVCFGDGIDETQEYYVSESRYVPDTDYSPKEGDTLLAPLCEVDEEKDITNVIWKEYTYHSFDFAQNDIENNGADAKEYALTDPVDVANYFILFNRIPPNYGVSNKGSVNSDTCIQGEMERVDRVEEVFGEEYTRMVSEYSIDYGYTKAIPASDDNETETGLLYYEFDIDLDGSYSVKDRGMGRIVGIVGGFYTNDDNTNVAVFTDDHYETFSEYLNYGTWGERFDANSRCRTGRKYGECDICSL